MSCVAEVEAGACSNAFDESNSLLAIHPQSDCMEQYRHGGMLSCLTGQAECLQIGRGCDGVQNNVCREFEHIACAREAKNLLG